jgi:hypothetical protein
MGVVLFKKNISRDGLKNVYDVLTIYQVHSIILIMGSHHLISYLNKKNIIFKIVDEIINTSTTGIKNTKRIKRIN